MGRRGGRKVYEGGGLSWAARLSPAPGRLSSWKILQEITSGVAVLLRSQCCSQALSHSDRVLSHQQCPRVFLMQTRVWWAFLRGGSLRWNYCHLLSYRTRMAAQRVKGSGGLGKPLTESRPDPKGNGCQSKILSRAVRGWMEQNVKVAKERRQRTFSSCPWISASSHFHRTSHNMLWRVTTFLRLLPPLHLRQGNSPHFQRVPGETNDGRAARGLWQQTEPASGSGAEA